MKNFNNFTKPFTKLNKIFDSLNEKVKTVFKDKIKEETFSSTASLSEDTLKINILGLGIERSYEDRSVYLNIKFLPNKKGELSKQSADITTWLNGEEAIKLGQILIKHGLYSLEANMINHQKIHHYSQIYKFLTDDRIDKIELTKINKDVEEYTGIHLFKIKPIWKKGKEPKYQEEFEFEDLIHISPFDKEFKQQLKEFGGIRKVIFKNFDYETEKEKFKKFSSEFN